MIRNQSFLVKFPCANTSITVECGWYNLKYVHLVFLSALCLMLKSLCLLIKSPFLYGVNHHFSWRNPQSFPNRQASPGDADRKTCVAEGCHGEAAMWSIERYGKKNPDRKELSLSIYNMIIYIWYIYMWYIYIIWLYIWYIYIYVIYIYNMIIYIWYIYMWYIYNMIVYI